jgi:hypothetical protein
MQAFDFGKATSIFTSARGGANQLNKGFGEEGD